MQLLPETAQGIADRTGGTGWQSGTCRPRAERPLRLVVPPPPARQVRATRSSRSPPTTPARRTSTAGASRAWGSSSPRRGTTSSACRSSSGSTPRAYALRARPPRARRAARRRSRRASIRWSRSGSVVAGHAREARGRSRASRGTGRPPRSGRRRGPCAAGARTVRRRACLGLALELRDLLAEPLVGPRPAVASIWTESQSGSSCAIASSSARKPRSSQISTSRSEERPTTGRRARPCSGSS